MAEDAVQISLDPDRVAAFNISSGFRVGDLVFVSGQVGVDDVGEIVGGGDFLTQARHAFGNLRRVLVAAGSSLDQVVKVTILVTDMSYFPDVVELRREVFSPPYPADTICEVRALAYPELMFEIEAVALAEGRTIDADG